MNLRERIGNIGITTVFLVIVYGAYAGITWLRYGCRRSATTEEVDPLLDRFMSDYEVVQRHHTLVQAPAEVTLAAACDMDFDESRIVRTIFKARELLLHGQSAENELPRGLLAKTKALGWGVLAEIQGREIVMGAVTQPWVANAKFRALSPEQFASFCDSEYVKIAWTLRADPVTAKTSIFRTETRALACGPISKSKFRKYWALLSPGIVLIRHALLRALKRSAERRALWQVTYISNHVMKPIGVFYATREGHTRRIAEHAEQTLRERGSKVEVLDLRTQADGIALNNYSGVILAASVAREKHEREMTEFVKRHRSALETMPTAFLSVTLSEAGAERSNTTAHEHAQFVGDVQKVMDAFFAETSWHPKRAKPVAGALLYTKYNVVIRFIMKRIAKKSGGDTDTSRDYEYTDWAALDRFVEQFAAEIASEIAA